MMDGHEIRGVMCNKGRIAFKDAGLSYHDLTLPRMERLQEILDRHLRGSKLMKGTFKANKTVVLKFKPDGVYGAITCRSHYFDKREAITFSPDGFIGFAGWADHVNIVPVVSGFMEWIAVVVAGKEAANPTVLLDLPWEREPVKVHILGR
jgi:hypothetical protein